MKLTDSELDFLAKHQSAAMVTVAFAFLALFRLMQNKPTGPISWFGGEFDDEGFLAQMAAEQRLIYEFEPHHIYGPH